MLIRVKAAGYEEDNQAFKENLRPYQAMYSGLKSKERQVPDNPSSSQEGRKSLQHPLLATMLPRTLHFIITQLLGCILCSVEYCTALSITLYSTVFLTKIL
jgi:hypothetical protein